MLWQTLLLTLFAVATVSSTETVSGKPCYFPFTYDGEEYTECVKDGLFDWCYTSEDYAIDDQWSYCLPEPEPTTPVAPKPTIPVAPEPTTTATSEAHCVLPFLYKGTLYNTCITHNNFGQHWCSTTKDFDKDKKWMPCADKTLWPSPSTESSDEEKPCKFPFIYRNESYDECTTVANFGVYWCATSDNYDKDGRWKSCSKSEEPKCVFPFTYNATVYSECTDVDSVGLYWCATTKNYDLDSKWRFCTENMPEPIEQILTVDGELCVFPFYYEGRRYDECTSEDSYRNWLWCSLTTEYKGEFGYCDVSKK
ncbi:epididymal sperm-binding protein 1-like [Watersipora subatra]|uniref:epididymal sperm-binding protein 1-like n=1 Tax=Watersipora subatra TaxID=2589382 RepID=UPI00355B587B